jgi:adenosylcobinamide kinase/adenosylcobinamide-phosphate guanylyltransferase
MTMTRTLVLGGARSGKSLHAEKLAAATGKDVVYIATAQAGDAEMAARIEQHRQQRDHAWTTVEEAISIGATIEKWSSPQRVVLIDCLTVWLSNLLFSQAHDYPEVGEIVAPDLFHEERQKFLRALEHAAGDVILVSNEIGQGVIPHGAISRFFVDEAGRLHQAAAVICDRAVLVVAGLPLTLKG